MLKNYTHGIQLIFNKKIIKEYKFIKIYYRLKISPSDFLCVKIFNISFEGIVSS